MIVIYLTKPLSFHIENLKKNNIKLSKNSIKNILQSLREDEYPSNEKFLKNISKIRITLDKNIDYNNIPICFKYVNLINPKQNEKLEKYVIFSSIFQMNQIQYCTQLYIDETFKSCPNSFYQIINFARFLPKINSIIPIFMVPTTSKSEFIYDKIFKDVKDILLDNKINISSIPHYIMVDFEKSLIKSIEKNFENTIIDGCYFHFIKLLWSKDKSLNLCKKDKLKNTKILIFVLKILPFVEPDEKNIFFKKVEEYYKNFEEYYKLVIYFKKNWLTNKYINFYELENKEYLSRTNNYIERFHGVINQKLDCFHPKVSYLINSLDLTRLGQTNKRCIFLCSLST